MLDDRARLLLKTLIERYIAEGQPVGSRTLSRAPGLELSPATIRNVMSDLEALGLIASPHTSAGRVPTARGYRLFVDTMLTAQRADFEAPQLPAEQPQRVIAHAAQLLSNLSQFVGVVMAPRRSSAFRHIEFLRLSERRLLLIIVAPDGDVQNRVLFTDTDYTASELQQASNYLNAHFSGLDIEQVRLRLRQEVDSLRGEIAKLMHAAVQLGSEAMTQAQDEVVISGERNLLAVSDFSGDMNQLRRAFELFEQKAQLIRLLRSGWQPPVPREVRPAPVPENYDKLTELDLILARGEHRWKEAAEREEGYKQAAKRARFERAARAAQASFFEQEGL